MENGLYINWIVRYLTMNFQLCSLRHVELNDTISERWIVSDTEERNCDLYKVLFKHFQAEAGKTKKVINQSCWSPGQN